MRVTPFGRPIFGFDSRPVHDAPNSDTAIRHGERRTVGAVTEQDEDRVSLAPLEPEDALRALLAVDPDAEPADEDDDS